MSRKPKKRNKTYTGIDAAPSQPTVHRYVAVQRSPLGEWWQTNKKIVRIVAIVAGVVIFVGWLLFELISLVF